MAEIEMWSIQGTRGFREKGGIEGCRQDIGFTGKTASLRWIRKPGLNGISLKKYPCELCALKRLDGASERKSLCPSIQYPQY